jgi:hypothetical protein
MFGARGPLRPDQPRRLADDRSGCADLGIGIGIGIGAALVEREVSGMGRAWRGAS